jgi:starch phosphorylase
MKFMMNGAITIGTLDGANIEIRQEVGDDNFFLFGLTEDEVVAERAGYNPRKIIANDADLKRVVDLIESGHFNEDEPNRFNNVINAFVSNSDPWMTIADFRSFVDAQHQAGLAYQDKDRWAKMSILNAASSGMFSTDRTMEEYNDDIWHLDKIDPTEN